MWYICGTGTKRSRNAYSRSFLSHFEIFWLVLYSMTTSRIKQTGIFKATLEPCNRHYVNISYYIHQGGSELSEQASRKPAPQWSINQITCLIWSEWWIALSFICKYCTFILKWSMPFADVADDVNAVVSCCSWDPGGLRMRRVALKFIFLISMSDIRRLLLIEARLAVANKMYRSESLYSKCCWALYMQC